MVSIWPGARHLLHIIAIAAGSWSIANAQQHVQSVLVPEGSEHAVRPVNVAIIGAGAAGSSSAYHLSQFAASAGVPINITVFERNSYIGGRSTVVYAYDDHSIPVELGASIFVKVNTILNDAVAEFNLSTTDLFGGDDIPGPELAVWDGRKLVLTQNSWGWLDIAKLLWKYGLDPIKTMRLTNAVVSKFLAMYEPPHFPFRSLTDTAIAVGLFSAHATSGEWYMRRHAISDDFARDVVQASTRVNYAQNLAHIHGLEAMVCMAADGGVSVAGGNWQIFDRMVAASKAAVLRRTAVTGLERLEDGSWELDYSGDPDAEGPQHRSQAFDAVVLAAPHQFANLSMAYPAPFRTPEPIPYVTLHVTLFTSPHLLSPAFFALPPDHPAPRVVLTTLPADEPPQRGCNSAGSPGFFSVSLLHAVRNPRSGAREYVYKIFSPAAADAALLARLLGLPASDGPDEELGERDVTWMYRKVWRSYPYEYPREYFEEIELHQGLWYTGGMESFISTMETNALMGKNVARLVVDEWTRRGKGGGGLEQGALGSMVGL